MLHEVIIRSVYGLVKTIKNFLPSRVIVTGMSIGQACGVIEATSVRTGDQPRKIPYTTVCEGLKTLNVVPL
jgi:hypothetical protein